MFPDDDDSAQAEDEFAVDEPTEVAEPPKKKLKRGRPRKIALTDSADSTNGNQSSTSQPAAESTPPESRNDASATPPQSNDDAIICDTPNVDDFILTKFLTNKKPRYFIARVIMDKKKKMVSFLRKSASKYSTEMGDQVPIFHFPAVPDVANIKDVVIERKVEVHSALKRERFTFQNIHTDFYNHIE